ncbi:transposase [Pseudogemmobacter hezensis]|uniref:transposase n=1 Tax=Pseudogemmobacter hezensis TaxID=2737662 RepID=UPI00345931C0
MPPDEQIGTVTGDGAFDTRRCHTAILERGGTAVIPIRKNGRRWRETCPTAKARNEILKPTQRLGRAAWKRWSGYHARSRIEAKMTVAGSLEPMAFTCSTQGIRGTHRIT